MYKIIATEDFINMLRDLPLKHLSLLTCSFVSITKMEEETIEKSNVPNSIEDILKHIYDCEQC